MVLISDKSEISSIGREHLELECHLKLKNQQLEVQILYQPAVWRRPRSSRTQNFFRTFGRHICFFLPYMIILLCLLGLILKLSFQILILVLLQFCLLIWLGFGRYQLHTHISRDSEAQMSYHILERTLKQWDPLPFLKTSANPNPLLIFTTVSSVPEE